MGLLDIARADVLNITTNTDEWAVAMTFTTPDQLTSVNVNGLHTKHLLEVKMDTQERVNSKKSSVSISEADLVAAAYPVRDNNTNEVALLGHFVAVKDSTGRVWNYVVNQNYPDETLGLIVCILGDLQ